LASSARELIAKVGISIIGSCDAGSGFVFEICTISADCELAFFFLFIFSFLEIEEEAKAYSSISFFISLVLSIYDGRIFSAMRPNFFPRLTKFILLSIV
jgi:hypothetical protein